mmetsp:Transcript_8447/g.18441  ORF Transcript_8447/g.18441 Transcript_8447/m.18441 type:complete len:214 (-) Transcript_8447:770-1411(-)
MALALAVRTSGMGSRRQSLRPGRTCPRYGESVLASDTIVTILPVMAAAFLFRSAPLSLRARPRMGTSSAREGASMECMNSQSSSASRASLVREAGSAMAASSTGDRRRTSGFRMTEEMSASAALAASLTLGWGSLPACISAGTTCGRHDASCLGAQWAIIPSRRMASCRLFQATSPGSATRMGPRTCFTPCADSLFIMTLAASPAASRTWSEA